MEDTSPIGSDAIAGPPFSIKNKGQDMSRVKGSAAWRSEDQGDGEWSLSERTKA